MEFDSRSSFQKLDWRSRSDAAFGVFINRDMRKRKRTSEKPKIEGEKRSPQEIV